ncbi:hypothetical protein [Helicobacter sp. T3_23-1059]
MKKLVALCALIVCVSIIYAHDYVAFYDDSEYLEIYKKEGKNLYRFWGLDYCLGYSKKIPGNTMVANLLNEQEAILRNVGGKEAFAELKDYIDKYTYGHTGLYLCLEMYDSPKYNAEIERIMKKYCKECE